MPNRFIQTWRNAASELELNVTPSRVVLLPSGKCLVADLWIEGFGSPRGVLLFSRFEQLEKHAGELQREDWAYIVLDVEGNHEPSHETIMGRLRSWGWFGGPERMPGWLIGA